MRLIARLLGCSALLTGGAAIAGAAPAGDFEPATVTATAEFVCTAEAVTVNWTLTVADDQDGSVTAIDEANASPDFGAVTFTPATGLADGDVATGSSTHAPDTTDVALNVEFTTAIVGGPSAPGETTVETPVECPPPPPEEPEDPPVVEPDFTG